MADGEGRLAGNPKTLAELGAGAANRSNQLADAAREVSQAVRRWNTADNDPQYSFCLADPGPDLVTLAEEWWRADAYAAVVGDELTVAASGTGTVFLPYLTRLAAAIAGMPSSSGSGSGSGLSNKIEDLLGGVGVPLAFNDLGGAASAIDKGTFGDAEPLTVISGSSILAGVIGDVLTIDDPDSSSLDKGLSEANLAGMATSVIGQAAQSGTLLDGLADAGIDAAAGAAALSGIGEAVAIASGLALASSWLAQPGHEGEQNLAAAINDVLQEPGAIGAAQAALDKGRNVLGIEEKETEEAAEQVAKEADATEAAEAAEGEAAGTADSAAGTVEDAAAGDGEGFIESTESDLMAGYDFMSNVMALFGE